MTSNFIHLGIHSEFSLKDSLVRVYPLADKLKELGMHAVGISDAGNMFSAIKIYQAAMKKGVKPIIGSEVIVQDSNGVVGLMSLYAQNIDGYKKLMSLISRSFDECSRNSMDVPVIPIEWLKDYSENLIALTGARNGILGKTLLSGNEPAADEHLNSLKEIFGNRLYLELQRTGHPDDNLNVRRSVRLSIRHKVPVVATNGVRFIEKGDFESHEIRVSIAQGITISEYSKAERINYTEEQYLKSPAEMAELFSDIPSAISNTVQIAQRCSVDITLGKNFLPVFPVPEGMTESDFITVEAQKGLDERLEFLFGKEKSIDPEIRKPYLERLEFELNVINQMKFPGYFLIVADFIQWAKNNNVPVGPGRGSGAGSLVAYALKITDLDPLKYDLLFERFLNPERVSMPDFDIDFCMIGRERVIQYVADKYGHKAVSQIITFGTMAAKMVVRDVARTLGHPYMFGDRIAKLIPGAPGTTLTDALASEPELKLLYETDLEVRKVIDHCLKLEGLTRQVGKHAGGVLIAPSLLEDFTPTYRDADGTGLVSQYYKDDVENAGLVKFDFLGLRTLTIIKAALDSIHEMQKSSGSKLLNIDTIPLDDPKTFALLQNSETTAVFQLESQGMKNLLHEIKLSSFDELIALVALYRPGPMEAGMVKSFVNRKHGREKIEQLHPLLEPIMKSTYGVMVYQEQVMQTSQVLAGYTLGQADMLRRAMGKKKPEEMAKQREIFIKGALATNNISEERSGAIFDLMEKFAGYGFNKSHSAAYALIAYQTAFLKAHYPSHFMAAVMSSDDRIEKVVAFMYEATQMGIKIVPSHINHSKHHFYANEKNEIVYGLGAVKGLGGIVNKIIAERDKNGPFKSLLDFCLRCNPDKRVLEASIQCGALDGLGQHRASLMASYPKAQDVARKITAKKNKQQDDLFGDVMEEILDSSNGSFACVPCAPWSDKVRLAGEKKTLGLYLTGHPLDEYEGELKHVVKDKLSELCENEVEDNSNDEHARFKDKKIRVAGQIIGMNIKTSKKGLMCRFHLDDKTRRVNTIIPSRAYGESQSILAEDAIVVIDGKLTKDFRTGEYTIVAFRVETIDMIRAQEVSHLSVNIDKSALNKELSEKLKELIKAQDEGYCPVVLTIKENGTSRDIPIEARPVRITDEFLIKLNSLLGDNSAKVIYKKDLAGAEQTHAMRVEEGDKTREIRHRRMYNLLESARMAMG
ncbi:DNA polymerase III subunit alpha [Pseudomonas luteola]